MENTSSEAPSENSTNTTDVSNDVGFHYNAPNPYIDDLKIVIIAVASAFTLINLCILLTYLSPRCRAKSVTWYLYHLTFIILIDSISIIPRTWFHNFEVDHACFVLKEVGTAVNIVISASVIYVNFEMLTTALVPPSCWSRWKLCRYSFRVLSLWIVAILFIVAHIVMDVNFEYSWICNVTKSEKFNYWVHVFRAWVAGGVAVFGVIVGLVMYIRGRQSGFLTLHIFPDDAIVVENKLGEWYTCLVLINFLYIVNHGLLQFVRSYMLMHYMTSSAILLYWIVIYLALTYGMPMTMLVLSTVRVTLRESIGYMCGCKKPPQHNDTIHGDDMGVKISTIENK